MANAWQLQEAKNKFSNLVERAQKEGPQIVTRHGKEAVVVLSIDDYREITRAEGDLLRFIQESPLAGLELDLARDKRAARDVDL